MARRKTHSIEVHARAEDYGVANEFVTQVLNSSSISKETAEEAGLVFEALCTILVRCFPMLRS